MTPHLETQLRTFAAYVVIVGVVVLAGRSADSFLRNSFPSGGSQSAAVTLAPDELLAAAAVLYDPTTGQILFAKNEEQQLPLASLTKLMTAAAVLSDKSLSERVRISSDAAGFRGDSGLRAGDEWRVRDLLRLGLIASSNDAMAAVAAASGSDIIDRMNAQARELGLAQTYFLDPTGLDMTPQTAGAYGSARDMAVLTAMFIREYPQMFETTTEDSVTLSGALRTIEATSTSIPIHDIPGLIGTKTGYTRLAGGNLVAAFDIEIGHPLIAVVLHSTENGRFNDMRLLIEAARQSLATSQ